MAAAWKSTVEGGGSGRVARSNLNKNYKLTAVVSKLKRTEVVTAMKCQLL